MSTQDEYESFSMEHALESSDRGPPGLLERAEEVAQPRGSLEKPETVRLPFDQALAVATTCFAIAADSSSSTTGAMSRSITGFHWPA